jgi:GxxExxY protein
MLQSEFVMSDLTRSLEEDSKITKISFDLLSKEIVDCAFKIHQILGAGLLESIYEEAFVVELERRNIAFVKQKVVDVVYDGVILPSSLRLDLLIEDQLIVELKSVEKILNVHTAQILTYMRVSGCKTGLLINFGEPYFKMAIKRFVL